MKESIFVFGRMLDDPLCAEVIGVQPVWQTAVLRDHAICSGAALADGAGLYPSAGARVEGRLLLLEDEALSRLEVFLGLRAARPCTVEVTGDSGPRSARAYLPDTICAGQTWSFAAWQNRFARAEVLAWREMLALVVTHPPEVLQARHPMAMSHAASSLRAQAEPVAASLRGRWQRDDVSPVHETRPYAWYFAVAEDDLQFRRFDRTWSATVKRAALVMSDAVTVLPYDPRRDVVMLVEQFRYGPWLRGAQNPWSLEPIAGRVDPGERPEEAALREAQEEARVTLAPESLLPVANCYPSPGAITEFLYQFVALCDLPDGSEGVAGLESEAEDIRSHVVPFARLMDMVARGEVQNGPLVLTAYWLALNRERLQEL